MGRLWTFVEGEVYDNAPVTPLLFDQNSRWGILEFRTDCLRHSWKVGKSLNDGNVIDDKTIVFVTGTASGTASASRAFLCRRQLGIWCWLPIVSWFAAQPRFSACCDLAIVIFAAVQACVTLWRITVLLNTAGKAWRLSYDRWDDVNGVGEISNQCLQHVLFNERNFAADASQWRRNDHQYGVDRWNGRRWGGMLIQPQKHAIVGFTKQLAWMLQIRDLGEGHRARCDSNADECGWFCRWRENGAMGSRETPVKRWAQPEEVAALTLFLPVRKLVTCRGDRAHRRWLDLEITSLSH